MTIRHPSLAGGRWNTFSFPEQMANIGSEVERTIRWKGKDNAKQSELAFERALELLDFSLADPKNSGPRRRELTRVREVLVDFFAGENEYGSSDELWQKYFFAFTYYAAKIRGM